MIEETDLQANGGDARIDEAPVSFGQPAGDEKVPSHERADHQEESSDRETELVAETQ
jgi:hypothetical protein